MVLRIAYYLIRSSETGMIESWITQLRKGVVEYGVLLVLARGETYGYEVVRALKENRELAAGESTVYPILARLREEGYLTCRVVKGEAGPPRRYFLMTEKGRMRLAEMEAYWPTLEKGLERLRNASPDTLPPVRDGEGQPRDPSGGGRIPRMGDERAFWA